MLSIKQMDLLATWHLACRGAPCKQAGTFVSPKAYYPGVTYSGR